MNVVLDKLFERLRSSDEIVHQNAITQLAMLLEMSFYKERNEDIWKMILPMELLELRLSNAEIEEMLNRAVIIAESEQIPRGSKLALVGLIERYSGVENAEVVLRFFYKFSENFTEQEAFSFLGNLIHFLLKIENVDGIHPLIVKYNVVQLLENIQISDSRRLREAAVRILNYVGKK